MTESVKYILKAVKKTDRPTAIRFMETLNNSGFRRKKSPDLWAFFCENNLKSVFPY